MEKRLNSYSNEEIQNKLGPIEHYNTLLFDNIIAEKADCEGAMAVAGNAQLSAEGELAYDIGGANKNFPNGENHHIGLYENSNKYPTFLLGGKIDPASTKAKVYEGPIVLKESYKEDFSKQSFKFEIGDINYIDDNMVDTFFKNAAGLIKCTSDKLFSVPGNEITSNQFRFFTEVDLEKFVVPDLYKGKKVAVLNYKPPKSDTAVWFEMYFNDEFRKYDLIVINIDARVLNIAGGAVCYNDAVIPIDPRSGPNNPLMQAICSRLVFNCPNTEIIDVNRVAFFGSLIAPKANITGKGGSINGMIIANSLHQQAGFQPHAFSIALGPIFWLPCNNNQIIIENTVILGSVKIIKKDAKTGELLAGAVFSLFRQDYKTGEYQETRTGLTTDANGELNIKSLSLAKYKLVETQAPPNYYFEDIQEIFFEIGLDEKNKLILLDPITITNLPFGELRIIKVDGDNNRITLPGAVFKLVQLISDKDGKVIQEKIIHERLVCDEYGCCTVYNLRRGRYKLIEIESPRGYVLPENPETIFDID